MTDVYGHLCQDRLDEVTDALDAARDAQLSTPLLLPRARFLLPKCCQTAR